jgi:predicted Zn-dependent protease
MASTRAPAKRTDGQGGYWYAEAEGRYRARFTDAAGNSRTASDAFERLLALQPSNMRARELLARALFAGRQYRYLTRRFQGDIARADASPYLLTVVARGFEAVGDRAAAGRLLDSAAMPRRLAAECGVGMRW